MAVLEINGRDEQHTGTGIEVGNTGVHTDQGAHRMKLDSRRKPAWALFSG
jgi:hypothetical protein